ncbi:MAG: cytochrome c3 family protein [Verrucomicrobiota bacterium]
MAVFFPRLTNLLPLKIAFCLGLLGTGVALAVGYYFTPKYTKVGYEPAQPVPFSHEIHSGQLGLDCRYCHSHVDKSSHSNIPSSETCMNCHKLVKATSPKLEPIRKSYATGEPVEWVRIHKAPDYVYFNHAVHVNRGVSCVSCHGKVNEMEVVNHAESHSMGWCLSCHRSPEKHLRPLDEVYNLDWKPEDVDREAFYQSLVAEGRSVKDLIGSIEDHVGQESSGKEDMDYLLTLAENVYSKEVGQTEIGNQLKAAWGVRPPESCSACHR